MDSNKNLFQSLIYGFYNYLTLEQVTSIFSGINSPVNSDFEFFKSRASTLLSQEGVLQPEILEKLVQILFKHSIIKDGRFVIFSSFPKPTVIKLLLEILPNKNMIDLLFYGDGSDYNPADGWDRFTEDYKQLPYDQLLQMAKANQLVSHRQTYSTNFTQFGIDGGQCGCVSVFNAIMAFMRSEGISPRLVFRGSKGVLQMHKELAQNFFRETGLDVMGDDRTKQGLLKYWRFLFDFFDMNVLPFKDQKPKEVLENFDYESKQQTILVIQIPRVSRHVVLVAKVDKVEKKIWLVDPDSDSNYISGPYQYEIF